MSKKLPRRWFNFSLRTMFVAVTALCCWLGWESSVVRERRAVKEEFQATAGLDFVAAEQWAQRYPPGGPFAPPPAAKVPLVRRWLGDRPIQEISYTPYLHSLSESDLARLKRVFPEAELRETLYTNPLEPCHPGCFPRGTLVQTPSGLRPIEEIQSDDSVTSVRADGELATATVQSVFITDNRLWEITTEAGVLITTETQPLCLSTTRLRAAGELQPDDTILHRHDGEVQAVKLIGVSRTKRVEKVYNLILGDSEVFIAGGFLARSKPPRGAGTPQASARREPDGSATSASLE